ncbi:MAG: DEAD/DEAH box helicase, partial [Mesosutterella sp.]|nr:DEAD/DEAH box helicase [Mesosutterella sp.]
PLPGVEFACRPGEGRESLFLPARGGQVQVLRDLKLESQHYEAALSELSGLGSCLEGRDLWRCGLEDCLDFLGALQRCPAGSVQAEWPAGGRISRPRGIVSFDSLKVSAERAGAWLQVGGGVEVDGRSLMSVSKLLEAVRASKGRYVRLTEDSYAEVSEALRKRLRALSLLARDRGGKIEVPAVTAPFLQDLRQEGAGLELDRAADTLLSRVEEASRLYPKIPPELRADLRDYQAEGYRWMSRLAAWGAGACLADDMGLGKTVQAVALLLSRAREGAALVVTPASVLYNWKNELGRFAPGLRCAMLGPSDREKTVRELGPGDVLLTTYGLLAGESELLSKRTWRTAVLDEAHMIRNRGTRTSQAARSLSADFRLILTGTPVQNNLSEIWSLFEFINPGLLGSFEAFTERFITPIEVRSDPGARQTLRQIISPFVLRRTKASVLEELPQKTEITLPVELSAQERALYEKIRSEALIRAEEKETSTVDLLATLMKLRQAACSPRLVDPSLAIPSSKEEAFMGLARSLIAAGHRALVFSQFTSHLALIRGALDQAGIPCLYMDGSVRAADRASLAAEFQKGLTPLFLISLKAGGTGLNLTAADYVIHLDPWWNPSVEDQASDRAFRIGQTLPVTVYRLIAKDTVEERILELHRTKKQLSDALLEGTDAPKSLSREDILRLLGQPAEG